MFLYLAITLSVIGLTFIVLTLRKAKKKRDDFFNNLQPGTTVVIKRGVELNEAKVASIDQDSKTVKTEIGTFIFDEIFFKI